MCSIQWFDAIIVCRILTSKNVKHTTRQTKFCFFDFHPQQCTRSHRLHICSHLGGVQRRSRRMFHCWRSRTPQRSRHHSTWRTQTCACAPFWAVGTWRPLHHLLLHRRTRSMWERWIKDRTMGMHNLPFCLIVMLNWQRCAPGLRLLGRKKTYCSFAG